MSYKFVTQSRKIIAVGLNYTAHAQELGGRQLPTEPLLFLKPPSSYAIQGHPVIHPKPKVSTELHHEVELGVVIGKGGKHIPLTDAMKHVGGYVLAIDMTARDVQNAAKNAGLPWLIAKGMDTFCPVSPLLGEEVISNLQNTNIWLKVDQELRQNGNTKDMIFSIPEIISFASSLFTLEENDLILTGTPAGVGPVRVGQVMTAGVSDKFQMQFEVVAEQHT